MGVREIGLSSLTFGVWMRCLCHSVSAVCDRKSYQTRYEYTDLPRLLLSTTWRSMIDGETKGGAKMLTTTEELKYDF